MKIFVKVLFAALAVTSIHGDGTPIPESVGGKFPISKDDQSVRALLDTNLARLDYGDNGNVELVAIQSITEQVVAGLKYEVTGTFKISGRTSECVVTLWSRAWLEDENEKVKLKADCGGVAINTKNDDGDW